MNKYFAGRIPGRGEIFAKMDINQAYGGDYSLYTIVSVQKIYWMNGPIVPASTFEGLHIMGGDYNAYARNTFEEAKELMLQHFRQGRADLEQAIARVDFFIKQVSDVGE